MQVTSANTLAITKYLIRVRRRVPDTASKNAGAFVGADCCGVRGVAVTEDGVIRCKVDSKRDVCNGEFLRGCFLLLTGFGLDSDAFPGIGR